MKKYLKTVVYSVLFAVCCLLITFTDPVVQSVLPPLIAIGLAFITKQVIISLFCGVWSGAAIVLLNNGNGAVFSFSSGFLKTVDTYAVRGLNDESHIMIVLFSLMIGGMIGIVTASGGMHGIVNALSKKTDTGPKSLMLSWAAGVLIFFDDYANTLIVGNTMRPLTDRYKISREKLSFIVDSTSAPVASLALLSTWIGYEVGLIGDALKNSALDIDPYSVFIYSLPYRFYAIVLLVFLPVYIVMKRDFGPMLEAEKRSCSGETDGERSAAGDFRGLKIPDMSKCKWYNAAIPVIVLIVATMAGIIISGLSALDGGRHSIKEIISNANSFKVLIWGSLIASLTAGVLMVFSGTGTVSDAVSSWVEGIKSMITAMIILVLAWGLGGVIAELKTAENLAFFLSGTLPLWGFPAIVFVTAGIASFATGTSWGTMALLFPTALPLALAMTQSGGADPASYIFIVTGAILTGAIFGDHCSPISDTTIMSSMSSGVSHIEHVRTQMPYALVIGSVALVFGYLPAGFFIDPYILIVIQLIIVFAVFRYFGKKTGA